MPRRTSQIPDLLINELIHLTFHLPEATRLTGRNSFSFHSLVTHGDKHFIDETYLKARTDEEWRIK